MKTILFTALLFLGVTEANAADYEYEGKDAIEIIYKGKIIREMNSDTGRLTGPIHMIVLLKETAYYCFFGTGAQTVSGCNKLEMDN